MQSRQTLLSFKSAAGIWKQDRWKPIVAGAVNLGTNVLFVILLPDAYKLDGVIFSTILGFAFIQIPWETYAVFTTFFGRAECRQYCRSQLRLALSAAMVVAAAWSAAKLVPLDGMVGLFAKAAVAASVSSAVVAIVFRGDALALISSLRRRK
jgi:peptidoglycan biosynthesis protein MviN/MurJ (putative lipid II flippase)